MVYQGLPLAAVTLPANRGTRFPRRSPAWWWRSTTRSKPIPPRCLPILAARDGLPASVRRGSTRRRRTARQRRVILLSQNPASAREQAEKLRRLGCDVRAIADPKDLEAARKDADCPVLLFDGTAFGTEGPGIVGAINARNPSMKVVVFGVDRRPSGAGLSHPPHLLLRRRAVRRQRDRRHPGGRLPAASPAPPFCLHREFAQALGSISITNRNRTRVRLMAAPGLLRHEEGLGQLLRHKLMQRRFPLESSPSQIDITPMNILSAATHCDRLIVLLAQDIGRLPGSLARDTKAEYIALVGAGADKVTTLLVQPSGNEAEPLGVRARRHRGAGRAPGAGNVLLLRRPSRRSQHSSAEAALGDRMRRPMHGTPTEKRSRLMSTDVHTTAIEPHRGDRRSRLLPVRQVLGRLSHGRAHGPAAEPTDAAGADRADRPRLAERGDLEVRVVHDVFDALPEVGRLRRRHRCPAAVGRRAGRGLRRAAAAPWCSSRRFSTTSAATAGSASWN